ncbi:hypothetical protein [Saccharopolyspora hattusasensis]|uniref:hypothetical protein n=1 Tax=Saccharopolyspora hattusasensis TaxID=1128679 RepID=UPI003D978A62
MIRNWPIRLRLTAAFTLTMALILTVVALVTVTNSRASLDESITESLQYRLRDVQSAAEAVSPVLSNGRYAAEQVLEANQQAVASSREVVGQVLLSPAELAAAQHGPIMVDTPAPTRWPGPCASQLPPPRTAPASPWRQ